MSREALQTVTNALPVLIPCGKSDMDGIADTKDGVQIVQVLTPDAILSAIKNPVRNKDGPLGIPERVWKLMTNLKLLHNARQRGDLTAAKAAGEELARMPQLFPVAHAENDDVFSIVASVIARDATSSNEGHYLCMMTNRILEGSRILLWQPGQFRKSAQGKWVSGGAERLGVFCPTIEAGIAQLMFCDGIRICLRCHDLFLGKSHQDYCNVQCRETHRVARWRERKALKGKHHGRKN